MNYMFPAIITTDIQESRVRTILLQDCRNYVRTMSNEQENQKTHSLIFGRYNLLLCSAVAYYGVPSALNIMAPVFAAYTPAFMCKVNSTELQGIENTTTLDWSNISSVDHCTGFATGKKSCPIGFQYDRNLFQETVTTEFDLVCERKVISQMTTSLYMVGILIGSLLFGFVSDRYGRKFTMVICSLLASVQVLVMSRAPNVIVYSITKILLGCFSYGVTLSAFVYVMEMTTPKYRTFVGMSSQSFFAVGYMLLSVFAFFERNWRKLYLITVSSYIPFFVFMLLIPESYRWLHSTGKNIKAFKKINKRNKNMATSEIDQMIETNTKEEVKFGKTFSFLDLFRTPHIRKITLCSLFTWFTDGFVFYGISLNAGALDGNIFINHALNGVFQLAGYLTCQFTMDRFGHKSMLSIMFGLSGFGLLTSTIMRYSAPNVFPTLVTFIAFFGKMGISGTYAITYNYTAEVFPTVIRSKAIGICSVASRCGSILAPFVIGTQDLIPWLPNTIFATFTFLSSALVMLMFPETNQVLLPETIQDGEDFIKKNSVLPKFLNC